VSDQIKFEVTCDPCFARALDSLGSRLGKTRSEVIRDGLSFYNEAVSRSVFRKWEESNDSAKADEKNRLIDELQEVAKQFVEAKKELDIAREARDKAIEKERDASRKANILGEKKNQLTFDLQNFFLRLHSTESMQGEEQ
jgi:hypothetical protein